MEDTKSSFVKKYDKIIIYFVIYTIVFVTFVKTLPYTIPYVLALIIASIITPIIKLLAKWTKQKIGNNVLILFSMLIFYGIIGTLLTYFTIQVIDQSTLLVTNAIEYVNTNYESIAKWVQSQYEWLISNIQNIDPGIIESGRTMLGTMLNSLKDVLVSIGSAIGGFALSLIGQVPTFFLIVIFTVVCSFFFTKMFLKTPDVMYKYLPTSKNEDKRLKYIIGEGKNMVIRYGLSYLLVILITGAISTVGYMLMGIPYALVLGVITAFLDLMPVLGVSAAYLPLAIYYLAIGNYTIPVGLGILYIIVAVGRNIWEPRIVASSLDMNPIITIMAIFIGLKINGIIGMFYLMFMAVGYKVLQKVQVLDTFEEPEPTPLDKQD